MTTYVDSSVLLRILLSQPDHLPTWSEIASAVSSELVKVETLRTIDRVALRGGLDADTVSERRTAALALIGAMTLVPIGSAVLERAGDPFPTSLGTLDAIHLATAVLLRADLPDLEFATHDAELSLAARSIGFEVHGV